MAAKDGGENEKTNSDILRGWFDRSGTHNQISSKFKVDCVLSHPIEEKKGHIESVAKLGVRSIAKSCNNRTIRTYGSSAQCAMKNQTIQQKRGTTKTRHMNRSVASCFTTFKCCKDK